MFGAGDDAGGAMESNFHILWYLCFYEREDKLFIGFGGSELAVKDREPGIIVLSL